MKVKYSYGSIYNRRPNECYGMGTENLIVSGEGDLIEFLEGLQYNSSIKFDNDIEFFGEESCQNKDWTKYIGQPMFFIVDLKIEKID